VAHLTSLEAPFRCGVPSSLRIKAAYQMTFQVIFQRFDSIFKIFYTRPANFLELKCQRIFSQTSSLSILEYNSPRKSAISVSVNSVQPHALKSDLKTPASLLAHSSPLTTSNQAALTYNLGLETSCLGAWPGDNVPHHS
jgi:hypothetical protein